MAKNTAESPLLDAGICHFKASPDQITGVNTDEDKILNDFYHSRFASFNSPKPTKPKDSGGHTIFKSSNPHDISQARAALVQAGYCLTAEFPQHAVAPMPKGYRRAQVLLASARTSHR
jgi:hypothetical protein